MKKWAFIGAIIIAVAMALTWWLIPEDKSNGAELSTAKVERRTLEQIVTATGSIEPRDYVDVGAQVSGQLEVLHVEVGDYVEAGQLLAEIDATVFSARLDGVRAQLKYQQAQLAERIAMHEQAQLVLRRQQRLLEENATSEEALEAAIAQAKAEAARVEGIKAQIEQTESSLRADEANLNYTRIYAPMSGTVVSMAARRGQTLNAAQTTPTILTIADLSVMRVEAQVSEADISRLMKGTEVYFTTLGSRGERWYSALDLIEPTPSVENNVVLYNALFDVENETGRLLPQMTTQVFFIVNKAEDVLSVPASAISPRGPQRAEVKVRRNGEVESVMVETGLSDRVYVEIKSGLQAGDEVVLSGGSPQSKGNGAPNMRRS
ncbi:efflux RND transporter periplasmic adaptor subunit [Aliidiomarina taiwanensis]|uniref:Efflux RND transporter periplasmic adaptor subunit n=1 Tax=Aliidiomarina taiwanensis TaxID=946228 RepID=A0A432X7I8_9GAMM|nr:efflux RND transporter periplasmic adaptor subunit [Aliidiomarina taiwanensis]RUO42815.1 efflux RND transporter periplasmic adaptor subunit [Aliidiomarina taiwanensis]